MNDNYRDRMEAPMGELASALWDADFEFRGLDSDIVSIAARKITLLRKALVAAGMSEQVIRAIMEDT